MARVLIVDDDPSIRRLIRIVVQAAGLAVAGEAADGAEAIRLVRELDPDVITMDLDMPVMDGATATAELSRDGRAPIVIVSGSRSADRVGAALAAGAAWHVAKRDLTVELPSVLAAIVRRAA